jgi:hypothetical protein
MMAYTQDNFDWQAYIASGQAGSNVVQGGSQDAQHEGARAYQDYVSKGSSWLNSADQAAAQANTSHDVSTTTQVTPATAQAPGQQNVADYTGQLQTNPGQGVNAADGTSLAAKMNDPGQTGQAAQISDQEKAATQVDTNNNPNVTASTVQQPTNTAANTYDAATTQQTTGDNQMTAAQGTVSDNAQVKAAQIDTKAIADGTDNAGLGNALKDYAHQNMSTIIDTSTSAGQLLAASLGDGNYVDSKATVEGQLALLQQQFVGPDGNPKIPSWAAATARSVSQLMGFSGMTGTAATASMSQALMEASLPIATSDANFFQTLTVQNLSNKQQSVINTANTLAKFEQSNLDNRQAAAVQNAQSFMQMDMQNLSNDQQTKAINNQAMIQSILSDANAKNVAAAFNATSKNQTDQFYQTLHSQIDTFNSSQKLAADQYNATMEDSRQKYNSTNAYNIAVSNANWRQAIQLQDDQQKYEAATADVKTATDLQTQTLNELWDRSDSLLDYAFQSSENDKTRAATLALNNINNKAKSKDANMTAVGALAGNFVGSDTFSAMMNKVFKLG